MVRLTRHRTMNNFTPRAQQVLALARKEADRFNHNYVGTEHLLLGLIKLGQGVAVNVLQKMGLDLETVRMRSEEHTSELQSLRHLVCRLLLEKKNASPARALFAQSRDEDCVRAGLRSA